MEYDNYYRFGVEARPCIQTEYEDQVFDELVDYFNLEVADIQLMGIDVTRLRRNMNFTAVGLALLPR